MQHGGYGGERKKKLDPKTEWICFVRRWLVGNDAPSLPPTAIALLSVLSRVKGASPFFQHPFLAASAAAVSRSGIKISWLLLLLLPSRQSALCNPHRQPTISLSTPSFPSLLLRRRRRRPHFAQTMRSWGIAETAERDFRHVESLETVCRIPFLGCERAARPPTAATTTRLHEVRRRGRRRRRRRRNHPFQL